MNIENLKRQLCSLFCGTLTVTPVPTGYAVSSAFEDNSGDRISFYITETEEGFRIEDDGSYLAELIAKDVPIEQGTRGQLLDAILWEANAYWDRGSYEIKTDPFPEADVPRRAIQFLSSMIRVRDLELITREVVRSSFREDAVAAITKSFSHAAKFDEDTAVAPEFHDYPADLIIRPSPGYPEAVPGAIYFVNSNDKLNEALLLQTEARARQIEDFAVVAMIEEPDMRVISKKRFQRAQNRSLAMPIFRGDEHAAMELIARRLRLPAPQRLPARN